MKVKKIPAWFILCAIIMLFSILTLVKLLPKKSEYVEFKTARSSRGNMDASINIALWSDFEGQDCQQAYLEVEKLLKQYGEKIKFEYRHLPLGYHPLAFKAAVASECANDQNKFWEYYNQLYQHQDRLNQTDLIGYAAELGLDADLFNDCMNSQVKTTVVEGDIAMAKREDITVAPTFIINGQPLADWPKLSEAVKLLMDPVISAKNPTGTAPAID